MMNRAGLDMLDANSLEQLKGQCAYPLVTDEYRDEFREMVEAVFRGERRTIEFKAVGIKGRPIWLYSHAVPLRNEKGEITSLLSATVDITERKLSEEKLKEREKQLSESQRIAHIGSWQHNLTTNEAIWSDELFRLLGLDPEKDSADFNMFFSMIHPDDQPVLKDAVQHTAETGEHFSVEYRFIPRDGITRIIYAQAELITDASGTQKILSGTGQDITERRLMEDELRRSRAVLREILDTVPQSIFWKDRNSVYLGCNAVFARAVGLDDVDRIVGKTDYDLPWPKKEAESYRNADLEVITSGKEKRNMIEPLQQADGTRLWIDTTKVPLLDHKGNVYGVLGVYDDITERREAEDKIIEALKEKEILLKEIHHRVKNNMAIISSLLQLQARYSNDENVTQILRDSQNRISSMALVHEKLYQTKDFVNINFREYVKELVSHLMSTHGKKEGDIDLVMDIADINFNIDTLIPCGLIINELTTNSLKHAFEGIENPRISMSFKLDDGHGVMVFSDNGRGIPEHVAFPSSDTLGLQIVNMLSYQLRGTATLDRDGETRFTITFEFPDT